MGMQLGNSQLTSAKEAAEKLGVTEGTVKKYVRKGILKGRRMGKHLWISGESINALPPELRSRRGGAPRTAVKIFTPPPEGPFTPQPDYLFPHERPERNRYGGASDWSFLEFVKETLFAVSIIACQLFAFVFSYQGAVLYLQGKNIYWMLGVPIDLALGFALTITLAILAILFSIKEKNIYQGLPIYFFLAFLSVYSSYVFANNESTNSARLSAVKEKAAKYLEAAKTTLGGEVFTLAEQEKKLEGRMEMEERHNTGERKRGKGRVWQALKNERDLVVVKREGAQANLERYDQLANAYYQQSENVTDPNALKGQVYQLSLQMPAGAVSESNSYAVLFKSDEFQELAHQRAWRALFSSNRAERNQARFTFLYSGMFEFIAFVLALYRVSRRFSFEEKIDGLVKGATLWVAKVRSWESLNKEVEQHKDEIKKQRLALTEMDLKNQHDEKTLKHFDKHVKNHNKAKDILEKKR
jgi:excisionase family DNA binding protein